MCTHNHTLGREVIQDMPKKEIQVWYEMMAPSYMIAFFFCIIYEKCSCTMLVTCMYLTMCHVHTALSP